MYHSEATFDRAGHGNHMHASQATIGFFSATDRRSRVITLLVWLVLLLSLVRILFNHENQWDFRVFYTAPVALTDGSNPYEMGSLDFQSRHHLSYLYPPSLLYVFKPLASLSFDKAYYTWLFIKLAALALLLRLWHRHFETLNFEWPIVLFLGLGFNAAILRDLTAGNIAIIEQLGLWLGFLLLLRNHLYAAGLVIAAVAQFKLMPVVFLGLLLLAGRERAIAPFIVSVAAFVAMLAANFVLTPDMAMQYVHSFVSANPNLDERGETNPSMLALIRDIVTYVDSQGLKVPAVTADLLYVSYVAVACYMVYWFVRQHSKEIASVDRRWLIYCGCLLYVLLMPRVKDYTYIIALIPTLFVFRRTLLPPYVPLIAVLLFLPPTHLYVPVIGRLIPWLQSYLSLFISGWLLIHMARHLSIAQTPQQDLTTTCNIEQPRCG